MLALLGSYNPAEGLSRPTFITCMALGGIGTLLTAGYMLVVVRRVCMGDPQEVPDGQNSREREELGQQHEAQPQADQARTATARLPDVRGYEYAAWTPLVLLTIAAGLWPALLLGLSDPAVQSLLPGVSR
jgi:NADH-quinone oxidoreductase subunit M